MTGLRTPAQKETDDFENSLSVSDRAIWKKAKTPLFDETLKKAIPDFEKVNNGERKLTAKEFEKVELRLRGDFTSWFPTLGMSIDGQNKARAFVMPVLEKLFQQLKKDLVEEK